MFIIPSLLVINIVQNYVECHKNCGIHFAIVQRAHFKIMLE